MPKDCSKCGTQNADGARFCRGCGAALVAASPDSLAAPPDVGCRACGALIHAGARFCSKCGADQTQVAAPAPIAPAASPAPVAAPDQPVFPTTTPPAAKPMGTWIGLGVVAVALIAAGAWWFGSSSQGTADSPTQPPAASAPAPVSAAAPAASTTAKRAGTPVPPSDL